MIRTVEQVLTAATDSVTLINAVPMVDSYYWGFSDPRRNQRDGTA
jgi:hypothetical protein